MLHHVADARMKLRFQDRGARRHALKQRIHIGDDDRRTSVRLTSCQRRKCRQPLRFNIGLRRHAVVGQTVPRREWQHGDVRREKGERIQRAAFCRIVGGNEQHQAVAAAGGFRGEIRIVTAGRAGNGEAPLVFGNVGQTVQAGDFRLQTAFNLSNTEEA